MSRLWLIFRLWLMEDDENYEPSESESSPENESASGCGKNTFRFEEAGC